jgi:hypothetical protein
VETEKIAREFLTKVLEKESLSWFYFEHAGHCPIYLLDYAIKNATKNGNLEISRIVLFAVNSELLKITFRFNYFHPRNEKTLSSKYRQFIEFKIEDLLCRTGFKTIISHQISEDDPEFADWQSAFARIFKKANNIKFERQKNEEERIREILKSF